MHAGEMSNARRVPGDGPFAPLESSENRMTFFRAHYDEQGRMVLCEKVRVRGLPLHIGTKASSSCYM